MTRVNGKRIWNMFLARNCEFFRDRAAFGWNFAFPFLIIVGFGIIFSGNKSTQFKVGVFPLKQAKAVHQEISLPASFSTNDAVILVPVADLEIGLKKLRHHKIDLLIDSRSKKNKYWVNQSSPKG